MSFFRLALSFFENAQKKAWVRPLGSRQGIVQIIWIQQDLTARQNILGLQVIVDWKIVHHNCDSPDNIRTKIAVQNTFRNELLMYFGLYFRSTMIIAGYDVNLIWGVLVFMTTFLTLGGCLVTTFLEKVTPQWFIDTFR